MWVEIWMNIFNKVIIVVLLFNDKIKKVFILKSGNNLKCGIWRYKYIIYFLFWKWYFNGVVKLYCYYIIKNII